jgi:hypothetical protein
MMDGIIGIVQNIVGESIKDEIVQWRLLRNNERIT